MEDRITPGLYLEMTDRPADDYASKRVPEVLGRPGVQRATWWCSTGPGRDDLPRRLPGFELLGLYEVDDGFSPPEAPADVRPLHLRRCPRPAQGRLTGRPTLGLLLVLISPRRPEEAQALRDWGDFVHLRHIAEAAVPGYTMITPYENATGGEPRFCHLYEMDTDDPDAAYASMIPLVTERLGPPGSEAWRTWATCPELRIDYVSTFRRLGAAT